MMKLTYIIPAYNASETIIDTLDSIYSQSLSKDVYEVIVVDDCSTDNTYNIVEQYAEKHYNLRLIHQIENHRQGAARNRGLASANGEYITFVDADDRVLTGVEDALNIAERHKSDIVYCSCYHERSLTNCALIEIDMPENSTMTGVDFCEKYQHLGVFFFPWGILYRREWLQALSYPFVEDRQHEDRDWLAYVMCHARTVAYSKQPFYRYKFNVDSTCHSPRYSTVFDHIASGIRHVDLAEKIQNFCPKSANTLYNLGMAEIARAVSLRNLTMFKWTENKKFYEKGNFGLLAEDMERLCRKYHMPLEVRMVMHYPILTKVAILLAIPFMLCIRTMRTKKFCVKQV